MESQSGLAALGVDWKVFVAQLINFAILFWLLNKFAFKPIVRILEERRKKVEQSMADAKKITEEKEQLSKDIDSKLSEAEKKAQSIILSSNKSAKEEQTKIREEANESATRLLAETQKQIDTMKKSMKQELSAELGALVVKTTERVIEEELVSGVKTKIGSDMKKALDE